MNVLADPSPGSPLIPELLYSFYQMEFACVTVCILMGGLAERGRILPAMIFSFVWMTIVYCPIGEWSLPGCVSRRFDVHPLTQLAGFGRLTDGRLHGAFTTMLVSLPLT